MIDTVVSRRHSCSCGEKLWRGQLGSDTAAARRPGVSVQPYSGNLMDGCAAGPSAARWICGPRALFCPGRNVKSQILAFSANNMKLVTGPSLREDGDKPLCLVFVGGGGQRLTPSLCDLKSCQMTGEGNVQ
ncbi:hypothetical protein E2C01_096375 [Portunus trituberculatus]|uniref:Uncharacterized protein n=1 Tax=Portunus trituberculatus TaxID=210409 RepID=A0A5B7K1K4_PORTR|nr:hypothetical protein [Portunus trituberculatus]